MFGNVPSVAVDQHGGVHRSGPIFDIYQSLKVPEGGPNARVVDDPVELRPVGGDLDHVVGVAELRRVICASGLRGVRRKPFMDADIEEPRMLLQLVLVSCDDLVSRVGESFVIEPPARER